MPEPFIEVRIHGVSGTSAIDLLQAKPAHAYKDRDTDVTRPADTAPWTRAFRWSSLTSGQPSSALWVLLLPYMLTNAAGWALPPRQSESRHRFEVGLTRVVGGFLTLIFSLVAAYGAIVVGGYSLLGVNRGYDEALGVFVGALLSLGSVWVIWRLTRSRDRGLAPVVEDPAAPETDNDWNLNRRAHLGIGAAATLWMLGTVAGEAFPEMTDAAKTASRVALAGLAVSMILLGLSVYAPNGTWSNLAGGLATVGGLATLGFGGYVWLAAGDGIRPTSLHTTGEPLSQTVVWFTVAALVLVFLSWSAEHRLTAATIATLISIAGASGAAVGAAIIQVVTSPTGTQAARPIGIIAEGFLLGLLLLTVLVLLLLITHEFRVGPGDNRFWRAFASIVDHPAALLYGVPTVVTTVSLAVFRSIDPGMNGDVFEVGARIAAPVVIVMAAYLARSHRMWALGIPLGGALLYWGFDQFADSFQSVSVFGTLVLPAGLIGSRIFSAYRDADARRGLAIAWDVGSYFPSVFHPFAPPPYGATAVASLRDVLADLTQNGRPVVVTAHSQGTVVAAQAVMINTLPVALCTVGSPLGTLYRKLFPGHFTSDIYETVRQRVAEWTNIWRNDDPVGGPILPNVDHDVLDDPRGRIHAAYWYRDETAYNKTMGRLLTALGVSEQDIPERYQ